MDDLFESDGVDDLEASFRDALAGAAGLGLAGITEAGLRDWSHWDALVALRERGELPIGVGVLLASGLCGDPGRLRDARDAAGGGLLLLGEKFYADGWLGSRTCACTEPFADVDPADTGVLFLDAGALARRVEDAAANGLRVATHAIGDRAIEAALDAYELAYGSAAACREARPRIEHAQLLRLDLIERIVDLGVVCCIQPCFAASDAGHLADAGFAERYPLAYAWNELLAAGASVVAGSDFPIETLEPLVGLDQLTAGPCGLAIDQARRLMTVPLEAA